jgi:MFS family permease
MVEKKEDLGNAIAMNSMMFNGARLIGPSLAGIMLATKGEGICFLINAISYVFVIGSLLLMRVEIKTFKEKGSNMFRDMKEGLDYAFGFAPIKHILLLLGVVSLLGAPFQVLMPIFAKDILHGGSNTYGFLMGAAGFGALFGALFLASRKDVIKLGRVIPAAAALFGAGLAGLSFTKVFSLSLVLMVIIGVGMMLHAAASNTILQTITDDDKRGRVMSFYTMAIMGTAPFGSLIAGSLAKLIGTPLTILIGGIVSLSGAAVFLKKLPELKKIVRPVNIKMGIIPEVVTAIQSATEPTGETTVLPNN